jgi:membrane-bound metal-dependent hydrolase YbcI (DUF457 family)
MPFTPIHMGPGLFIKALLQGSFSLMVFGWAQIVMDIQPLIVMITGVGHLHGFSHTYMGASLLALFSALTGKYLSEFGLYLFGISNHQKKIKIRWRVCFASAFIGTFSHVLLDSFMHYDVQPFYPFTLNNDFVTIMSIEQLHSLCLYLGIIGAVMYFLIQKLLSKANNHS